DVNGGPDSREGYFPHAALAIEFARNATPLEPTILVNSGHGVQAWWLFEDGPWVFGSDEERERMAQIARGWHELHKRAARALGYRIDACHDLARLMRLAGTLNGKGGPSTPVEREGYDGPRHEMQAIAELAPSPSPAMGKARGAGAAVDLTEPLPRRKFQ